MRVYIQKGADGECSNPNSFIALDGFRQMGWEICYYKDGRHLTAHTKEDVVVGGISDIKGALQTLGIDLPAPLDYPEELHSFLGRKIWRSTINTIANNPASWNVFVKPYQASKTFTGILIKEEKDLIGCCDQLEDIDIWCSEPVRFVSEWRCFVRYGKILDVRRYKGDWRVHYNPSVIENALQYYSQAPHAFALDFGLTDDGRTLLVEANDGYSLGSYGLFPLDYGKLLSARWAQMTGSEDHCHF